MAIAHNQRKGQIFSIDVLFALLPIMMIIGASLQYLYLVEEESKDLIEENRLETLAQGMADNMVAQIRGDEELLPSLDDTEDDECEDLANELREYEEKFLTSFVYHVRPTDYNEIGRELCDSESGENDLWTSNLNGDKHAIELNKDSSASEERFVLEREESEIIPGKIIGLSFTIWKDD